ncbi:MAG: nucleotide sugar dehydrogenase [Candidatus Hydrogenedens sp.]|nr:nucleotide sugar dehydrogenase [Candidatus Hydrogenedens sp.]
MTSPPKRTAAAADVAALKAMILGRDARVGIIGLGYVGLPLVQAFCRKGFRVVGFDVDSDKVRRLLEGQSYIHHLPASLFDGPIACGHFRPTTDYALLAEVEAIVICVPTPLTRHREPDMSYIVATAEAIAPHLKRGHLVSLESTTYPGTTREILQPILERSGLAAGVDFFIAFSPEREDPGNPKYQTTTIPKVVGADDAAALELATALYGAVVDQVVPVSSAATAEAVKLTENIFRSVNIALVNELKVIYQAMGVDVWEVIDAAKSKPFGFMPFYPGPGLGGHCIPIDPFYLTWKAREFDIQTRFIELAGEINTSMPLHVIRQLADALDRRFCKGLNQARILVVGIAYKKNVDDMRESPALRIIDLLRERGAEIAYYDPFVPEITRTREHPHLTGLRSLPWSADLAAAHDATLIVTDHDNIDYQALVAGSRLVVDTRNATAGITDGRDKVVKA